MREHRGKGDVRGKGEKGLKTDIAFIKRKSGGKSPQEEDRGSAIFRRDFAKKVIN